MRRLVPLAALALAACQTTQPPSQAVTKPACLPMAAYSRAEQARGADELAGLPPGSALAGFMVDYGALRSANRAACGH